VRTSIRLAAVLLALGMAGGAALDLAPAPPPTTAAGWRVVQADLHVHSFFGDGALSPIHLLLEARRRRLDAIAVTNHNQTLVARATRALSRAIGGPTVLVGEEITAPRWHLIGVRLRETVGWRQPLESAIADVHAQGGVAILAHPVDIFRSALTDSACAALDGTEVRHALIDLSARRRRELEDVFAQVRARHPTAAPIGSSDDHGGGGLGEPRTYVFARDDSEDAIVEAIRAGRTVAVWHGEPHGDPALVSALPAMASPLTRSTARTAVGLLGWAGVAGLLFAPRVTRRAPVD
jgi:predicted metal-dependent phosphoesterase TrpH